MELVASPCVAPGTAGIRPEEALESPPARDAVGTVGGIACLPIIGYESLDLLSNELVETNASRMSGSTRLVDEELGHSKCDLHTQRLVRKWVICQP